ncbi:MAG: ribosome biogenesis GTP-binding protein YihA/YsxC [Alphaproteobacteria bacterium]|nr:ribosome biogenesis GTP-binding protein YihA/YsxC [Alphaproteobacteria bacterium]
MIPKFLGSFTCPSQLPKTTLPEFALVGRSNVGKSSLINLVTGFSKTAKVSNTPGRTRAINMFEFGNVMLTDLPGYGFAQASKTEVRDWDRILNSYLSLRPIQKALLLIDSRRGFMPIDLDAMTAFDRSGTAYQIIVTKTDKIGKAELAATIDAIREEIIKRPAAIPEVIATSSSKKIGRGEVLAAMGILK